MKDTLLTGNLRGKPAIIGVSNKPGAMVMMRMP